MKKFYRVECKSCGRRFKVPKFKKMRLEQPELGMNFELDIENVIQNNYHWEGEFKGGKLKLDVKDLSFDIACTHCGEEHRYTMKQITHTDRLD